MCLKWCYCHVVDFVLYFFLLITSLLTVKYVHII